MKSFAEIDIENQGSYITLLSVLSKLSGLFSESAIPYLDYRVVENIFCRSFNANNLSRSDTAFDAEYNTFGVGLKTFLCATGSSNEKIAEFNSLSSELRKLQGIDLAYKLAECRNDRISLATRLYSINKSIYHIVARNINELILFETDYGYINCDKIHLTKQTTTSLHFDDGINAYSFNFSKSTLYRRFYIPNSAYKIPVEIVADPFGLLLDVFDRGLLVKSKEVSEYVVLPLYGYKNGAKFVFERSSLNQWNASGRKREVGEVYIPVPMVINQSFPNFFPKRYTKFNLHVPTGEVLSAKICQDNSKALMTDPNKSLSDWLLRKVLLLREGELATIEHLNRLGFDSVIIVKVDEQNYRIDIMKTDSYESFINNLC